MSNKALLIGVPEYKRAGKINIEVVRNDIRALKQCWEGIGITTEVHCPDTPEENAKTAIEDTISDFLSGTDQFDTVFLYWSGHGGHIDGADYLLCADYDPDKLIKLKERSFALSDLLGLARTAEAKSIIIFVDACRARWDLQLRDNAKNIGGLKAGVNFDLETDETDKIIAVLSSCSTDELSYFPDESREGAVSYFTQGLVEAFSPLTQSRTFFEVKNHVQSYLNQIQEQFPIQKQTLRILAETKGAELNNLVIAKSPDSSKIDAMETNPWSQKVLQSPIWSKVIQPDDEDDDKLIALDHVQKALRAIIGNCWFYFDEYRKSCPNDPWHDQSYPIRFVETLKTIIRAEGIKLRPSELAIAIVTPFILEAVISTIKSSKFSSIEDGSSDCPFKFRFDVVKSSMPQWVRKIDSLQRVSKPGEANWVEYWLVNTALFRSPEFRLEFPRHIEESKVFEFSELESSELLSSVISSQRIVFFLKSMLSSTDAFFKNKSDFEERFKFGRGDYGCRDGVLQSLLKCAHLLTVDIRELPAVVPDHLGLEYPVNLDNCRLSLSESYWSQQHKTLALEIFTEHPAFDSAILDIIEETNREYQKIVTSRKSHFHNLPTRLTSDRVVIRNGDDREAFLRPHLKFTLAQDEIRELLMGVELYGEPELALRELYQNAIDAIRYREARIKFLEKENSAIKYEYKPKIIFRQDKDEDGRAYIECIDNGVGMDRQIFSSVFAKAGKRFSEMSDFVEEQKQWDKHDIKLYPNSQFGVGVLSYFMLADHIEIETTRFEKDGQFGDTITASITGSGNLFRIKSSPPQSSVPGTKIRLYLKLSQNLSVQEKLSALIRIPEYDLEVQEWQDIVTRSAGSLDCKLVPTGVENVWWSSEGDSEILCDGVRIGSKEKGVGFLYINLKDEYKPRLSIDRKKLRFWREKDISELVYSCDIPNLELIEKNNIWFQNIFKSDIGDKVCQKISENSKSIGMPIRWGVKNTELSSPFISNFGFNSGDLAAIEYLVRGSKKNSFLSDFSDTRFLAEVSFLRACKILGTRVPAKLPKNVDKNKFSNLKLHENISSAAYNSLMCENYISTLAYLSNRSRISLKQADFQLRKLKTYNIDAGSLKQKVTSERVISDENLMLFDQSTWMLGEYLFFIPSSNPGVLFFLRKCLLLDISPSEFLMSINWLSDFWGELIDLDRLSQAIALWKNANVQFKGFDKMRYRDSDDEFYLPTSFVDFNKLGESGKRSRVLQFIGNINLTWEKSISLFRQLEEIIWGVSDERSSTALFPSKVKFELTSEHRDLLRSIEDMNLNYFSGRCEENVLSDLKSLGIKTKPYGR